MDTFIQATLIGTGATAVMDLWGILRRRLLGIPSMNYGLVGRWVAWLPRGRFRHDPIGKTPPVRGELALGWAAHYAIGIAFAGILVGLFGAEPGLVPALAVGIGTVAFLGLVVPHALRSAVRLRHFGLLLGSALGGALLLVLSDTLSRALGDVVDLRPGTLSSAIGAPFFLWLMVREQRRRR